jgi:hypothetical protein
MTYYHAPAGERRIFDDRLETCKQTEKRLITVGKTIAWELGAKHAPGEGAYHPLCAMCASTPLGMDYAKEVPSAKELENLTEAVRYRLPGDSNFWVSETLTDAYRQGFYDKCVKPKDCDECNGRLHDGACGHELNGDPCPAGGA